MLKTLESPLDYKEIQPVHPKGDQSWVFIGRTDFAAETPIFWPPELNIQKTKIMAFGPINSWEIDGDIVETMSDFILGGSKITADGDCSHEIKIHLLLGRKVITNLDRILKTRAITNKDPSSQSYFFFPVVMYGCESWTIKKAER